MELWSQHLQQLVKGHNLSAQQISLTLGLSHAYVHNLMLGHITPSLAVLQKLADFFDVPLASFFTDHQPGLTLPLYRENLPVREAKKLHAWLSGNEKLLEKQAEVPTIQCPWPIKKSGIALIIEGSLMCNGSDGYPPEAIVIFEPATASNCQQKPTLFYKSGKIRFRHYDSGYMRPLNPQFPAESADGWHPIACAIAKMCLSPLPDSLQSGKN